MTNIREIPAQYTVTEVGEIPSDWDVKLIGELGRVVRGASPRPAGDPRYFNGSFIPWLTVAALTTLPESRMEVTATRGYLTREGSEKSRTLPADTVIIANSGATLGVAKILKIKCCANDGIAALIEQRVGNKEFLCYYINTRTEYLREVVAPGNGQPNLNTKLIRELPIPFPTEVEQRAIAEALSDIDGLINSLDALIAKKQAIKQGMMQQLLTGKTRLPGFTESWREFKLGEVLAVRHGKSQRSVESASGRFPILATGGQIGWARSPLYSKPSVLIGRKGTIDRPQYQDQPFWTVDTLFYTEISSKADPRFLYYVFLTVDWRSMNEASGVPSLSSTSIESVEVRLPELAEQMAIRAVLDDADQEICLLESRLAKARAIKTGMMQQLLTGRTRLPIKESAA